MKKHVITVSRELGSGGNKVARELSKRLNIPYYDRDILNKTAQDFGISRDRLERYDEKKSNSFLYSLATARLDTMAIPSFQLNDIVLDDRAFMFTSETIKKLADSPCIIVGRCADYVLRERNIVKVFICADIDDRVKNVSESLEMSEKNALKLIQKTDKRRASYYNSFTDGDWGKSSNYHISVNTSILGIGGSVDVLQRFIELYNEKIN